jgi:SAM-dependent methyltransferase
MVNQVIEDPIPKPLETFEGEKFRNSSSLSFGWNAQRSETHRRLRLRRSRKRLSRTFRRFDVRQKWIGRLINGLSAAGRGRVLDLGCGAGIPVARELAALGHAAVGVDGSAIQVVRARRNVPKATFLEADMCEVAFEVGSFHAVGAFYSITHVPRTHQGPLIANIAAWLKPGGIFVASFGSGPAGEWTREWLGTTMFFGHNGEAETLRCLADSGLRVRDSSVEKQDNEQASFMWVEAVKDR